MTRSSIPRVELFGLPFVAAPDVATVAAAILDDLTPAADGHIPMLVTPNVDIVVQLDRPEWADQRQRWSQARWVLPDGAPIVWASRLLGAPLPARLAGSSLFAELWPALASAGRPALVVAPSHTVVERLAAEHPGLRSVVPPVFDPGDEAAVAAVVAACRAEVDRARPDVVVFGLSNAKQVKLVDGLIDVWPDGEPPLFLCLGASLDLYVGLERRAPEWVQRAGFEWFFRFLQDPRGKFRRYFIDDPRFVGIVWREWRRNRRAVD